MPAPIHVVAYDPSWPARFAEERAALARVLSPWLAGPIEHIGSTAVPELVAKPDLHLVPHGSALWHERLAFRDRLRADPHLAAEYAALKRSLAVEHEHDREAYTDAKEPFVRRVLAGL